MNKHLLTVLEGAADKSGAIQTGDSVIKLVIHFIITSSLKPVLADLMHDHRTQNKDKVGLVPSG